MKTEYFVQYRRIDFGVIRWIDAALQPDTRITAARKLARWQKTAFGRTARILRHITTTAVVR